VFQYYVVYSEIPHRLLWDRAWVSAVKSRRMSNGNQTPCLDIDDSSGDIHIIPWSYHVGWLVSWLVKRFVVWLCRQLFRLLCSGCDTV
jgi:hypothetical protein